MLVVPPKPGVPLGPTNCPSSHGVKGFLAGTVFDQGLGCFVCPCGRQYFSDIERPSEVPVTSSIGGAIGQVINYKKDGNEYKKSEDKNLLA